MRKRNHSRTNENLILKEMERRLPVFRAFATGLCGDRFVADDLVQSACERALVRLDQVRDAHGVKSWIHRIIYTQWQDLLRKRKRRKAKLLSFGHSSGQAHTTHNERSSIAKLDVEKALDILSADSRAALVLVTMSGYDYMEASRILDIPVGTVASRVARAKTHLANYLNRQKDFSVERSVHRRTYDESSG